MKLGVYSIYDTKAMVFSGLQVQVNDAVAKRIFTQLVQDERTNVNKFPSDYILYRVGNFDDSNGKLEMIDIPANLGHASDYVEKGDKNA